ncbi:MAG: aconitase X swivel domain-containing protein [Actinomycetota bacterium]
MAEARTLVAGAAEGETLVLDEPLSFWGGVDPATGAIVDVHHPQRGANVAGRVLVMPSGRGSSSCSSVLAEVIRAGTAPVAIVLLEPDPIVALGAIVARELYGRAMPVVVASTPPADGTRVRVDATGAGATIEPA